MRTVIYTDEIVLDIARLMVEFAGQWDVTWLRDRPAHMNIKQRDAMYANVHRSLAVLHGKAIATPTSIRMLIEGMLLKNSKNSEDRTAQLRRLGFRAGFLTGGTVRWLPGAELL